MARRFSSRRSSVRDDMDGCVMRGLDMLQQKIDHVQRSFEEILDSPMEQLQVESKRLYTAMKRKSEAVAAKENDLRKLRRRLEDEEERLGASWQRAQSAENNASILLWQARATGPQAVVAQPYPVPVDSGRAAMVERQCYDLSRRLECCAADNEKFRQELAWTKSALAAERHTAIVKQKQFEEKEAKLVAACTALQQQIAEERAQHRSERIRLDLEHRNERARLMSRQESGFLAPEAAKDLSPGL